MLLVTVDVLRNVLTPDQKDRLIELLTTVLIEVQGENVRPVVSVRINEFEGGDWAIGGRRLSAHDMLEIARGTQSPPIEFNEEV